MNSEATKRAAHSNETFRSADVGSLSRCQLVRRHNPVMKELDASSPLQIGNGRFAMALDPTGLQSLPQCYPVSPSGTLLGTQSDWGWHEYTNPIGHELADSLVDYDTAAGVVSYVDLSVQTHDAVEQSASDDWLRGNPHRLHLGHVGLWLGHKLIPESLVDMDQQLDLWSGTVTSTFGYRGATYVASTAIDPVRDVLAYRIEAQQSDPVGISLSFPYGSDRWGDAADWDSPGSHRTTLQRDGAGWVLSRGLDEACYEVRICGSGLDGSELDLVQAGQHQWLLSGTGSLEVSIEFVQVGQGGVSAEHSLSTCSAVLEASAQYWPTFWESGAAVQLDRSDDSRAPELERRVVLSQFLTAINCRGERPPAETGLMLNSWRGKFHLEMAWWHGAHFASWNRPEPLQQMLGWYRQVREAALETAKRQGLSGARWPKQVGPHGRESPSNIGPFLIWQQPQPIIFAELLYRCSPSAHTLERWSGVVSDTADFMASFANTGHPSPQLGPPVIPAQESYVEQRRTAKNPTFELALWKWGLDLAISWFERLGRGVPPLWTAVAGSLPAPRQVDGRYVAVDSEPALVRTDHPSMLGALGFVPKTGLIDAEVMGRTFDDAEADWRWETTWGWDYPMSAMTATRLHRPDDAVSSLLRDSPKNIHLPNGHNYQTTELPIYLPGNGGLLSAVALMAAGWDGCTASSPGFGDGWIVDHEGLNRSM